MKKGRILIVEDEFLVAANLQTDTETMGYTVVGLASTGEKALEIARRERPDLALMDIKIQGAVDGIETALEMREELDLPVIFITAFADDEIIERAKPCEPLGYLVKPFDKRELHATIEMAHYKLRMERQLRESETRFRTLFEYAPVAYQALDEAGCLIDSNTHLYALLGYDAGALMGKRFTDLCSPEAAEGFDQQFAQFKKAGHIHMELQLRHQNGAARTVVMEGRIQRDIEDRFIRAHCVLYDITDRKRAEEERIRLEQQLQQVKKADSLGRMAGAISHHYNNLLSVVVGNLELAMIESAGSSTLTAHLTDARNAVNRAANLSRLMLTYLGQTTYARKPLDLSASCREFFEVLQRDLPDTVTFTPDLSVPGPVIDGNSDQIRQIVDNLMINAREALGDQKGDISLSVKTVKAEAITTANRFPVDWQPAKAEYACLEVTDSGCGIANADLPNIFDPFFSTKFTGRGLGLPVLAGNLRQSRGCITVVSSPGHGSTFRIFLPLSDKPMPRSVVEPRHDTQTFKHGGCALLVEDHENLRKIVAIMLERIGFEVVSAKDGAEAVKRFSENKDAFRLVLSDLNMPVMNGWETIAALRAIRPDIPVILASGYDEAQAMAGMHTDLPNAFLHKPYDLSTLKKTLTRLLAG